jgi:putative cell wall-binding protein
VTPQPARAPARAPARPLDRAPLLALALVVALAATLLPVALPPSVPGGPAVAAAATNDPLVSLQWGLQQIRAPQAWSRSRGAGVTIAVVDSGVDLTHPDLQGKLVRGSTFFGCVRTGQPIPADGCGTGSWLDREPRNDAGGHGTHVAGIAAAATGNRVGIAGVAPDARIMPVKVLSGDLGGTTSEAAAGIRWATRNGADVINLSLGTLPGGQALGLVGALEPLRAAIRDAVAAGVVVVAAAGNDYVGVCSEPAFAPQVLCVGATDVLRLKAPYSNLPLDPSLNVVSAPGGSSLLSCRDDIVSTWPVGEAPFCTGNLGTPGYNAIAGTSMAAPHVAGVAALLLAQGRRPADVPGVIRRTAVTPPAGTRGTLTPLYGYGIVDAEAAVGQPIPRIVERVAGGDRTATAAAVSRRAFTRARTVVVARADDYADALAGAPLASHVGGPLLLTARARLSSATADEVARLGATQAILLGSAGAISEQVRRDLEARGVTVRRIGGTNRFATAARIAEELPSTSEVLLTEGGNRDPARGWPDALSASGLAAARRLPILLATRDTLPAETARALRGSVDVTIVGGRAAIGDAVAGEVDRRARTVRRIAGSTRYATSVAVAEEAIRRGSRPDITWVATGRAFADGLVAGAAAGTTGGVLLLVDGRELDRGSPQSRDFLAARRGTITSLRAVGGSGAITATTERRLRELLGDPR